MCRAHAPPPTSHYNGGLVVMPVVAIVVNDVDPGVHAVDEVTADVADDEIASRQREAE